MKETIGSMRLYFFLVGAVTVGVYGMVVSQTGVADSVVVISSTLAALFGAAFFYAAITLKTAVEYARTRAVEAILYVNMVINVLVGLLALPTTKERYIVAIRIIITLAIGFYLLANLKRLVKERAAAARLVPTPPPPIPAPQSPPEGEAEGQEEGDAD